MCVNNLKPSTGGGGSVMTMSFLAHFYPFNTSCALLSIVADHVHPFMVTVYLSSKGYFFAGYHATSHVNSNIKMSLLQSPDLKPTEHL